MYLYEQGQSTRTIQATLKRLYGAEVSSTLISEVTASVLEEVNAWQGRALESVYPIVYFDALFVKSREEGAAKTRAVYVALAIDMQGEKQVLGLWIAPTEGAVSWLNIFSELQARGMQDCFIACVDGLKGLPEAIETIYPHARVQLCIVHQVRKSLRYVSWKERKQVAASLRAIYAAPSEEAAFRRSIRSRRPGARSMQLSRRCGGRTGQGLRLSSITPRRSARSSTRRTRSNR